VHVINLFTYENKEDHLKENVLLFSSRKIFAVLFVEFPQSFTRQGDLNDLYEEWCSPWQNPKYVYQLPGWLTEVKAAYKYSGPNRASDQ
jgi:hypothetical protein